MINSRKIFELIILILSVILLNILINYINIDIDFTKDNKHNISQETKNIVRNLDDNIFCKIYLEGEFPAEFKNLRNATYNFLRNLQDISPDFIQFEFINPNIKNESDRMKFYKELAKQGLIPTDLHINNEGVKVNQIIFPGAIIYYKDKSIPVNFLNNYINKSAKENINQSIEDLEYIFTSALLNITTDNFDKIAFLEGNGQLDRKRIYDVINSVMNDNFNLSYYFNVELFNLKELPIDTNTNEKDISKQIERMLNYKAIIIAKPQIRFNDLDKFLIDQYVMNGGKILWLLDGVNSNMDSLRIRNGSFIALKHDLNIEDQLFKYGVRINADIIEDLRSASIPVITGYSNNIPQQELIKWPYYPILSSYSSHSIVKNIDGVKCDFASSIDTIKNNIKKTILLTSSSKSRLMLSPAEISLDILHNPPPRISYNNGKKIIAVLLEGQFESVFKNRILPKEHSKIKFKDISDENQMIVISDGDIISNKVSENGNIYPLGYDKYIDYTYPGNKYFFINSVRYLCNTNSLNNLKSKELMLRMLDSEKVSSYRIIIQAINIIIPFLFLFFIFIIQRLILKKKYV